MLRDTPAHALSAMLERQEITAEALMVLTLEEIAAQNGDLNAIVSMRDPDALMAAARAADRAPRRGWLHGVPVAIKDLAHAAGFATSQGSPVFAGQVAETSDIHVARIEAAGAIVIGKTNTPEFGLGSNTYNPVHGVTRNARLAGRTAGGSSGGAAVAVASGMLAVADGSDMMGSLRNPAGWNGVYGLRPSWGLVPGEPAGEVFWNTISTHGPMARAPRDIALLLDTMAGPDPRQPHGAPHRALAPRLSGAVEGMRLGWLGDWGGAYAMEAGVLGHCRAELAQLAEAGVQVEDIAPPFSAEAMWEAWTTLRSFAMAGSLGVLVDTHPDQVKPEAHWEVARGRSLGAEALLRATALRSEWFRAARALFAHYDALILPTAQCWPFPLDWDWPREIAGMAMDTYHRWMEVMIPVSLIGLPCLAVPCRPDPAGRLIGLQIIGGPHQDLRVLDIGEAWYRLMPRL